MQSVPPPDNSTPQARAFRRSVPIRIGAYSFFLGGAVAARLFDIYPLPVPPVLGITIAECLVLLLVRRRAESSIRWASGYLVFESMCETAILYYLGDVRLGVAAFVYGFELLNSGLLLTRRGHLFFANLFAAFFVVLVLLESGEVIPRHALEIDQVPLVSILVVVICLNTSALLYISPMRATSQAREAELAFAREDLRIYAAQLEERVHTRTEELATAYRSLREKDAELRDFIVAVTHDLKNRVNAIVLVGAMLDDCEGLRLTAAGRVELQELGERANEIEDMLRDLLESFSITSALESPTDVDLTELVRNALDMLGPQIAAKNVRVRVQPLPTIRGQRDKLGHLFCNLLSNAAKYVPAVGGSIGVAAVDEGETVVVCIEDNGIGVPSDWQTAIFEIFRRAPEQAIDGHTVNGSGIGLAVVKRVAETHGGTVWVESEPGRGSRFYVRLARGTASQAGDAAGPASRTATG
jgi:signal transduction histidine kinase